MLAPSRCVVALVDLVGIVPEGVRVHRRAILQVAALPDDDVPIALPAGAEPIDPVSVIGGLGAVSYSRL